MTGPMLNAWAVRHYGGPEELVPVRRPIPAPGPDGVLIRIRASAVTRADTMMRAGYPRFARPFLGWRRPRNDLVGTGLSGEVIAVGPRVRRFVPGDAVFGESGLRFGANASHIRLEETDVLMHRPGWLSHEIAASMCDGPLTSLHFLDNVARLRAGERILVLGGSGSLGSAAVQIAVAGGAEVTATARTRNRDLVASLGAHRVLDHAEEDPLDGSARYDVIFDTPGIASFVSVRAALAPRGRYVCPVLSLRLVGSILRTPLHTARRARFSAAGLQRPEILRGLLARLLGMVRAGTLVPVVDRVHPFDDLVGAHRYMESGHKRGSVVVV